MLDYGASWWGNRYSRIDETDLKRWMTGVDFHELSTFMGRWRDIEDSEIGRAPEAFDRSIHGAFMSSCDRITRLAETQHISMASLFDRLRFFVADNSPQVATATEVKKSLSEKTKTDETADEEVMKLWKQSLKDNPSDWPDSLQESSNQLIKNLLRATRSFRDLTKIDEMMVQGPKTESSQQQISAPKK